MASYGTNEDSNHFRVPHSLWTRPLPRVHLTRARCLADQPAARFPTSLVVKWGWEMLALGWSGVKEGESDRDSQSVGRQLWTLLRRENRCESQHDCFINSELLAQMCETMSSGSRARLFSVHTGCTNAWPPPANDTLPCLTFLRRWWAPRDLIGVPCLTCIFSEPLVLDSAHKGSQSLFTAWHM